MAWLRAASVVVLVTWTAAASKYGVPVLPSE